MPAVVLRPVPLKIVLAALMLAFAPRHASAAGLSGLVSDPDGRPVADVRIVVSVSDIPVATTLTTADGRYTIASLPPGRYTVLALRDGFRASPVAVDVDGAGVRDVPIALALSAIAETLVVSAAQVDVPLSRAPGSVTIVPAGAIEARQIESAADALRFVPGLAVARSGGRGALTSIFPRGGESDYTLVLVDGVKANAFGGGFDFSQLAVADLDQIEVVRGAQSALFGSNAIGGVVQLVTRHGGPVRGRGLVEYGGFDTARAAASTAGSTNSFAWHASGEGWRSAGFEGRAPATGERVTNDDGRSVEGGFGAGWSDARAGEIRVDGRVASSDRGFPGPFGANPIGAFAGVDTISRGHRERRQFGVRYAGLIGGSPRVRQRASLSHTALDGRFVSAFAPDDPSTDETRRLDVRLQTDVALGDRAAITGGLEHTRERGASSFVVDAAGDVTRIDRRVTAGFGELRVNHGGRLFVASGVRIEDIRRDPLAGDGFSRPAFPGESIVSTNPKLALTWYARPERQAAGAVGSTRVRVTAGTGIRPADVFEIAFTDNPRLKPERSRSVDAGIGQSFAGGAVLVDATAFVNAYDDLIVAVGRAQQDVSRYRTDNISNARARGLEVSAAAHSRAGLDVQAAFTWLSTKILAFDGSSGEAPAPFKVGDPLIRRPRRQVSVTAAYARERVTAFVDLNGRGRALDIEPNYGALFGGLFTSPGYVVSNAGASIRVTRSIDVYGRVLNLFDRRYEEVFGYPALGRAGTIGVRVAVRR